MVDEICYQTQVLGEVTKFKSKGQNQMDCLYK